MKTFATDAPSGAVTKNIGLLGKFHHEDFHHEDVHHEYWTCLKPACLVLNEHFKDVLR